MHSSATPTGLFSTIGLVLGLAACSGGGGDSERINGTAGDTNRGEPQGMPAGSAGSAGAAGTDPGVDPIDATVVLVEAASNTGDGAAQAESSPDAGKDAHSTARPDGTNTGVPAGASLAPSASIVVTQAGQIVENKDVQGSIVVKANNVIIRASRVKNGAVAIDLQKGFSGLLIEDVTVEGVAISDLGPAIRAYGDVTIRRLNLSKFGEGVDIFDAGGLIEDSYFHDMSNVQGKGSDTVEVWGGRHLVIRHNTLEMSGASANSVVKFPVDVPDKGDDVTVDDNVFAGGGYALIAGYDPGSPTSWTNVRVTNNRFSTKFYPKCGFYGPGAWIQSSLASGNVWHETGMAVKF